jgi:hypothetical protein
VDCIGNRGGRERRRGGDEVDDGKTGPEERLDEVTPVLFPPGRLWRFPPVVRPGQQLVEERAIDPPA